LATVIGADCARNSALAAPSAASSASTWARLAAIPAARLVDDASDGEYRRLDSSMRA
jgi:hypothetical protein